MARDLWIGAGLLAGGALLLLGSGAPAEAIPVSGTPVKTYDAVYRRQCPRIPVEYLRALAARESRNNAGNTSGEAWGLLEVIPSLLDSFNTRQGTTYNRYDLLDPDVNAKIACELIQRVTTMWDGSKYAAAFPGGFNWSDTRHVNLITFAWNAGWSESRGVSGVILHLISQGRTGDQITIDTVRQAAMSLSWVSQYVKRSDKVTWCKSVTALYMAQLREAAA